MPHAVTHVLIVVVLLELFRHYIIKKKETFPLHYIIIGGIAGLIPDFDVLVYYASNLPLNEVHRTFSHTLFFPVLFVILGFASYGLKNKKLGNKHLKIRNIFFVIAFGIFMHLVLDMLLAGSIMPVYPVLDYNFGLNLIGLFPLNWQASIMPSLDALLLIVWMISLELRHKMSKYI
jgi:membrane-bound metal-dependent hydrolase YbcI (DUF457 family)